MIERAVLVANFFEVCQVGVLVDDHRENKIVTDAVYTRAGNAETAAVDLELVPNIVDKAHVGCVAR